MCGGCCWCMVAGVCMVVVVDLWWCVVSGVWSRLVVVVVVVGDT